MKTNRINFRRAIVLGVLGFGGLVLAATALTGCPSNGDTLKSGDSASDTAVATTSGDTSDTGPAEEISHTMVVRSKIPACKDDFLSGTINGLLIGSGYKATASVENDGPEPGKWYMNLNGSYNDATNVGSGMTEELNVSVLSATSTDAAVGICGDDDSGTLTYFAVTATP